MSQSSAPAHIGVAGYMGAGKSTCAALLCEARGMRLVDADAEAKLLMENNAGLKDELAGAFGGSIVCRGLVDFKALGTITFSSTKEMEKLNRIVHPLLVRRLLQLLSSAGEAIVLDAALIPLWGIEDRFDCCLWITADRLARLSRVCARTGLSDSSVRQRMLVQEALMSPPSGPKWAFVNNEGTLKDLAEAVRGTLRDGCNRPLHE